MPGLINNEEPSRLGINLPTPFIETIEVLYGDTGTDQIRLTVNLYLPGEDGGLESPDESLAILGDLYIYAAFVIGNGAISQVLNKERYNDLCFILANYETDGSYNILAKNGEDIIQIEEIYQQISISDFEYVDISSYDEIRGINIFKYTTKISLTLGGTYDTFDELFDDVYESEEDGVTYKDLSVFCFSSIYDFGEPSGEETLSALQNYHFFNTFNSDIAYEKVFVNGAVYDGLETIFKYVGGNTYHGTVIQSLSGEYHAEDPDSGISLSSILSEVQLTIAPFRDSGTGSGPADGIEGYTPETAATATTTAAGETSDSISTLVAEEQVIRFGGASSITQQQSAATTGPLSHGFYGMSSGTQRSGSPSQILANLSKAAAAIPDKSTTTRQGQLYNSLAGVIGKYNTDLKATPTVYPEVVKNIKVVDIREQSAFADYEYSDVDAEIVTDTSADPIEWDTTPDRIYGQPD